MRLHHLEATAFGPFAETVTVDFDALSEAGLFLLSGATGAGKTSILDAVCFALYGDVPGDRNTAKRLRSDQASPGLAPRVTLEATLAGRRFRITRSPQWQRAKKRGTGTTSEQSSVTLLERVDGEWRHLSSRLDETGHLIGQVVGMTVTQFTQVAMLPQGRFQSFLRARSEERHAVLQHLFRTGRFADVERWLRERRVLLRRDCDAAQQTVADLVSRVSEAVDSPLPPEWDLRDLAVGAEAGDLLTWVDELTSRTLAETEAGRVEAEEAATSEARLRAAVEQARATHALLVRHQQARAEQAALLARAQEVETERVRLHAARRAAQVVPLLTHARQARRQHDAAAREAQQAGPLEREVVTATLDSAVEGAARTRGLLPTASRLAEVAVETAGLEARRARLVTALDAVQGRRSAAGLGARIARLEELATVASQVLVAHEAWNSAKETALLLKDRLLSLREARLDSMAGEIACALAVGACCPVCGSAEHPHKATSLPGAPDAAAEKVALKEVDDANATEHLRDLEVRDLLARRGRLEQAGTDHPADLTSLREERDQIVARHGRSTLLPAEDPRALEEEQGRVVIGQAETIARLDALCEERQRLHSTLDEALGGTGHDDLEALLDAQTRQAEHARRALRLLDALAASETSLSQAQDALTSAALDAGFAGAEEALSAALDEETLLALEGRLAHHDQRLVAVAEVLASSDPAGLDALDALALPDMAPIVRQHDDALARLSATRGRQDRGLARAARLTGLREDLATALESWAPLRADLDLTTGLAAFVEGKSPDNRLRMRLSAYVLAYRLGQVVAAANERLAQMSDQRYSLVHTGDRGSGETRGGLSLLVRDDWSGETRDPATLSGGETFVVSLALALGLADVITAEVGGAALDTLFVDEGFGSLDADTLDDVMDTLDSLRDGGRVVGVVSHVAEMRDRIPTQLVVTKSRVGSSVEQRVRA